MSSIIPSLTACLIPANVQSNAVDAALAKHGKLLCSDVRPGDFGSLVCDMPDLKNPVPQNMLELVEILSGAEAFIELCEMRDVCHQSK